MSRNDVSSPSDARVRMFCMYGKGGVVGGNHYLLQETYYLHASWACCGTYCLSQCLLCFVRYLGYFRPFQSTTHNRRYERVKIQIKQGVYICMSNYHLWIKKIHIRKETVDSPSIEIRYCWKHTVRTSSNFRS